MGYWHAFSAARSGLSIQAIVDPQAERAEKLQREFGAKRVFGDLTECLNETECDVAHICTPANNHLESIEQCLDRKVHVLAEKPLLSTLAETKRMLEKANSYELKLAPVHQMPFQRGASQAVNQIDFGKLTRLNYTAFTSGAEGKPFMHRAEVLMEILPHPISLFSRYYSKGLTSDLFEVRRFDSDELEIDGQLDGASLRISISLRGRPTRNELTVVGDKATCHVDLFHGFVTTESGEVSKRSKILKPFRFGTGMVADAGKNLLNRSLSSEPAYPGLRKLIREFYQSALNGKPDPISRDEILLSAELIDKVRTRLSQ